MKKNTLLAFLLFCFSFFNIKANSDSTNCNWKASISNFYTWDTCQGNSGINSVNAYIAIKGKTCLKYSWSINGSAINSSSFIIHKRITTNGNYSLCVKITDTCNNCDTTLCYSRSITCFNTCNWKSKSPSLNNFDTCQGNGGYNSINAYFGINSRTCLKYVWSINGVTQKTKNYYINYPITQNGKYDLCVKVIDTCNFCDTTFCSTRNITCFSICNWKSKSPSITSFDTCKGNGARNSMNAYLGISNRSCLKYQWSVNGITQSTKNYYINYPISKNGIYALCVKVTDTCNHCDTTICTTRTFTCYSACNWKSNAYFYSWDTCKGTGGVNSVNAYISIKNGTCNKYNWTINGIDAGHGNILHHAITQNGTYNICVKVTDTCKNCDTTYCSIRNITCFSGCDFKARAPYFNVWDSCVGHKSSINGYINFYNRNCMKFDWTLDSQAIGNGSRLVSVPIYKNGSYLLCVKATDTCNHCDTTICVSHIINCNGLGIESNKTLSHIQLYPNPANNLITIQIEKNTLNDTPNSYFIYDIIGNLISEGFLNEGNSTLFTNEWPNGLYLVKVGTVHGDKIIKLIINH
ncbi:MAG: T9SS type A sorting domain-containing protein [bacterium]|nr:T9SS type A sorting domain-containing protein [bacterium]